MASPKEILLDGSTGEGGGQLVRMAVALAAVTCQPIKIINIRANRVRSRPRGKNGGVNVTGGGLKNQHVAAIKCLAEATSAQTTGLSVGSSSLTFAPALPPTSLARRALRVVPDSSASSAMLVLQAILPFLLFPPGAGADGGGGGGPVEVEIEGGTNTSFSLSYEYMDQVLMPALEGAFGVEVERELRGRGWSQGPECRGCVWVRITPLERGSSLLPLPAALSPEGPRDFEVSRVDVSLVVPLRLLEPLQTALARDIAAAFPAAEVDLKVSEDSGHPARIYVLLVAVSHAGLRWGRDVLHSVKKRSAGDTATVAASLSRLAVRQLAREVGNGGRVDEYLQDQLVCFQALAAGRTSFVRHDRDGVEADLDDVSGALGDEGVDGMGRDGGMRRDRTGEPFGHGSMHTKTARWVAAQLLPRVRFFNGGDIVEGAGVKSGEGST